MIELFEQIGMQVLLKVGNLAEVKQEDRFGMSIELIMTQDEEDMARL